ncbi:hypothetical protein J2X31_001563 [Flavobacterium arsenatis]|uniref:DUF1573 domain-containing protein n=1 Tax=Flavobacterium arsenatis TaxID=1484332 RepID=A0ABU1TQB4_9FLAO|nr:DUF1573 domain-containing protein [Flavobacterium arsenatis]MDR6967552.1 hypothetical protein [Flavobacterium arsenatis]
MINKALSIVAVALLLVTVSCKKETSVVAEGNSDGKFATMSFDKTEHDFGTIDEGDKVETVFTFTNKGEADLLITDAKGSCGCTVPEYPKEPVKPGEKAKIRVSFSSIGKKGMQNKTVTLTANTKSGAEQLTIKASVTPDPNKVVDPKKPLTPEQLKQRELERQELRKKIIQKQGNK